MYQKHTRRDGIFKLLRSLRIDSNFQGIHFARLCSLAGRYDNPIPTRFLAPNNCYKIPALEMRTNFKKSLWLGR
jgi:hypothetical protein